MIDHKAASEYLYGRLQFIGELLELGKVVSALEVVDEAIQAIDNNDLPEEQP